MKVIITNRLVPPKTEDTVFLNQALATSCKCTKVTIINWIKHFTVDGQPIGWKVGGRWMVNTVLLKRFINGEGERNSVPKRKRRKKS